MPLKNVLMEVAISCRVGGELTRWIKEGRFDLEDEAGEVKTGFTTCTQGGETVVSSADELALTAALFGCQNLGDGNILLVTYNGGSPISDATMQIKPGEIAVFRLPDSNNAGDKVTATLASGSAGRLAWFIIEDNLNPPVE